MPDPVHVLDSHYLALTFLVSLAIQFTAFLVSYTLQFDKITDFSGGSNFFILALLTFILGQASNARNIIVSLAVMLWAVRLACFLLVRVLKRGKDSRFDEMRASFVRFGGFWLFQLLWVWLVSLPVTVLNSPGISARGPAPPFGRASDIFGLIFFLVGMVVEAVADVQKFQWKDRPRADDELPVCTKGVWRWSRHPNYFGEILLWWGVWLLALGSVHNPSVSASSAALLRATVLSPLFITLLLLFISGLPTAEKPVQQAVFTSTFRAKVSKRPGSPASIGEDLWGRCQTYLNHTSILVPIPPSLYRRIPEGIKKSVLLDWPMYRFDERGPEAQRLTEEIRAEQA